MPDFEPRPPWWGGDLQTLRNVLVKTRADLAPWPAERILVRLPDGDRLPVVLHSGEGGRRPLVVAIHGLTGCEDSLYLRATTRWFLESGWPVLRVNLRGAGPAGPLCPNGGYHAGRSEDLRALLSVLRWQRPELVAKGVMPLGFSLGGAMLLKFLAENDFPVEVPAAAAVSPPIDLAAAQVRLMAPRNALYQRYILHHLRREPRASAQRPESPPERRRFERAFAARSIQEFDEVWTGPRNGFAGAKDYYRRCSAGPRLAEIRVPTLLIQALDDPWIPAASYRAVDWAASPALTALLPAHGGHVGFHGTGRREPWHDRVAERFFAERLGLGVERGAQAPGRLSPAQNPLGLPQPLRRRSAASTAK
ncbi:MAG: alpha/beta fold hydrolase [Tistlia sp.]